MTTPPRRARRGAGLATSLGLLASLVVAPAAMASAPVTDDTARSAPEADGTIAPAVLEQLAEKDATDFWIRFEATADTAAAADVASWADRGDAVVDRLVATADAAQAGVREQLDAAGVSYESFWVTNAILVEDGSLALAEKLVAADGVGEIRAPQTYELPDPVAVPGSGMGRDVLEWGVQNINADDVWEQYGVRGEGVTVANIDSGVALEHPALVDQYRGTLGDGTFDHGYNWFDATGTGDAPYDTDDHGSHTMGTMIGDDGEGNQIGVAPEADWIAANGCSSCSDADLIASGQWMLAPTDAAGENPDPSRRPHVVNNSWGSIVPSNDPFMEDIQIEWRNAGIFGVWSNGNSGPSCETSGSPGSRTINYSVGAYDVNDTVAGFSGRGPGQDGEIKPSISAPGVNVRSALADGVSYGSFNGTSMAAPHVAGAIALLWSAAPTLVGDIDATEELLNSTAIDTDDTSCGGTAENNNVYGEGRLDALALLEAAPVGATGTVTGTVLDETDAPVEGVTVSVIGVQERSVRTDADGRFSMVLSEGEYLLTTSAFGYEEVTTTVRVAENQTLDLSITLTPADTVDVTGTVTDGASEQPEAGVEVSVPGTPITPVTTAEDGTFTLVDVPLGTYTLTAEGGRCQDVATEDVEVDGPTTVDLVLPQRQDGYGYFCTEEPSAYVEVSDPVELSGDEATTSIELPFDFPFYGETYSTAYLSSNGHLNFAGPVTAFSNVALPAASAPNAAIYPYWDDLTTAGADAAVYSGVVDDAFVIEYRNVSYFLASELTVDFQVHLHEDGTITFAYRNLDPESPRELGDSATVGIENADGTDALQYAFNEAALTDDTQITFGLPLNGRVEGTVTDENDGLPVAGATVTATDADGEVSTTTTDADGSYALVLFEGVYRVVITADGYTSAADDVVIDTDGEVNTFDAVLATGVLEVDPGSFSWLVEPGETRTAEMTVTNTGSADLTFEIGETARAAGPAAAPAPALRGGTVGPDAVGPTATVADAESALADAEQKAAQVDPNARTALGLYSDAQLEAMERSDVAPTDAGDVLDSWVAEEPQVAWGLGYDGDVWVSDAQGIADYQYSTDGDLLSEFATSWGDWPGDMAADSSTGLMCQVSVGGDNGIHCFDQSGTVQEVLTGAPWSGISQRGLAYNPTEDVFYTGGWNEGIIYTVAGTSHPTPGETLAQCQPEDPSIAGIAYNPTSDTLWYVNSGVTTYLFQVDPTDCATVSTLDFPETASGPGAGLDLDDTGNLWASSQLTGTVYLIESGVPNVTDLPWLEVDPTEGSLAPGQSTTLTVTVDSTDLDPGVYAGAIQVMSDAGRVSTVSVPVELTVSALLESVNVAGDAYTGVDGEEWVADQQYSADAGWGWVGQRAEPQTTAVAIGGTEDDELFQSRRVGIFGYRFDDAPAGTYEIDLGFAEFGANPRPGQRIFDVQVNGEYVIVAQDVGAEVGGRWANEKTVTVEHEGGPLEVDLLHRFGYPMPILNTLAVQEVPTP